MAGIGLLLWLLIKAKGAEEDVRKWRMFEWGLLVVYVAVAIVPVSPFMRFFYITSQTENLQSVAMEELNAVKQLYISYNHQQEKFLTEAVEQIQNYRASSQYARVNDELYEYVEAIGDDVEMWADKAEKVIQMPKQSKEVLDMEERIESWNLLQLPVLAEDLQRLVDDAWSGLGKKIKQYGANQKLIPVIGGGGPGTLYRLDGYAEFDLGTKPQPKLLHQLKEADGSTVLGWILYIILHVMVLLNYFDTQITIVLPVSDNSTRGLGL